MIPALMRGFLPVLLLCSFAFPASSTPPSIAPNSGKQLCSALTPADFNKEGIPVTSLGAANIDSPNNVYCMYNNKGGQPELDIFYPAGDTPQEVQNTERTLWAEVGGKFVRIDLPGADSANINLAVPGKQPSASIAVRWKNAVFTLNVPSSANMQQQLLELAKIVLNRLQH
jgi:hypothetical protein